MPNKKRNRKLAIMDEHEGWKLRVYHKKGSGKKSPRFLVKCGCCDSSIEIFYSKTHIEINGVHASLNEWRELLIPLLNGEVDFGDELREDDI
ncbi:MAG: hypothetical protein JEZ02_11060 [Desulfatibacillum sp.]|nr:hypothetical protein [Desulfatibacillum sp.]